jgi:L-fucose dehydrogenase
MDLEIKEKIFLISGGASGIGKAIAFAIAEEGGVSCIIDKNEEEGHLCASELESSGKSAFFILADLTDDSSCKLAVNQAIQKYGRIDGVVNNAGLNDGVSLENGSYGEFINSLKRNALHYYSLVTYTLQSLKASKGVIVNIVSKTFTTGQGGTSGYAAANGVRAAFTENWALELKESGIRVNAVVVSECWTPQYKRWLDAKGNFDEELRRINQKIPFGNRMTSVEEVADAVVFLLSRKSAVNGQLLYVDGGYRHLDRAI